MMEAKAKGHVGKVQEAHNNNGPYGAEEPMLVDVENAPNAKWARNPAMNAKSSRNERVDHINETDPVTTDRTTFGAYEMLDDDSGDDVVLIRKQTSSSIGDFMQPPSMFRRNFSKEPGGKADTSLNSADEPGDQVEHDEDAGHLHGWIEDVMEAISEPFLIKKEATAIADLCKELNRPRLVINKAHIKDHYGYEIDGTTYLWAEEALYLLETGKLDLYIAEVAISVERARALLLHSKDTDIVPPSGSEEILSCENDEYTVYKYFAKLGYRIRRRDSQRYSKKFQEAKTSVNCVEVEVGPNDPIDEESRSYATDSSMMDESQCSNLEAGVTSLKAHFVYFEDHGKRGIKRRAELGLISEDEESEDASEELLSLPEVVTNVGYSLVDDELMEGEESEDTPIMESKYTVAEADDSDVEFVDEVIFSHSLVEIRELQPNDPALDKLENLPGPSTAQQQRGASPVIFDLSSSSDSEIEEITNESIWSTFSSVNIFEMKFPPPYLLPENIPARSDNKVYTYYRNQGDNPSAVKSTDAEEMEIEKNVDELKLSSTPEPRSSSKKEHGRIKCGSWKEWRHTLMAEARDVLHESLYGAPITNNNDANDAPQKLNLWPNCKYSSTEAKLRIPFDLFPIVNRNVSKHQLWSSIQPLYHVAVVRTTDPVMSSHGMEAQLKSFNDNVPLLVALVDDDSEVLVLSSDMKPLPSLF